MPDSPPLSGLERWLRSPARLAALLVLVVLVGAGATTLPLYEALSASARRPVEFSQLFGRQLLFWSLWGLASTPIAFAALWMVRRLRYWFLFLAIQVPFSLVVARGLGELQARIAPLVLETPQRGEGFRGPPRGGRFSSFDEMRGIFAYWLIVGLALGIRSFLQARREERHSAELVLQASRLENELHRAQVESLKKQLQPHFLFNALHTVGGLIRSRDEGTALRTLSALGDLLRTTLDSRQQVVPLSEELDVARRYLEIERINYAKKVAQNIAKSNNRAYLNSENLLFNLCGSPVSYTHLTLPTIYSV